LDEATVALVDDGWSSSELSGRQQVALGFADAYLAADGPMTADVAERFHTEVDNTQQTEIGIGLALFHGFSKVLIALGCEPSEMDTTILPTPGT
jgi:alkylhydroperoxidase family enzyme